MATIEDRTIALAAIAQACKQVGQIANQGKYDQDILTTAIKSILNTEPSSTEDIFGSIHAIHSGLRIITEYDFNKNIKDSGFDSNYLGLTKYLITSLSLSRKLLKNQKMLAKLSNGIDNAKKQKQQLEFLTPDDPYSSEKNIVANLAGLYQGTISTMSPRILVAGNPVYLEQADNANRVRSLLLAAIRSGILWHQLGGTRWQLLFQRKKIIATARKLLNRYN
ncbi:MAG: high frequency lysogenization protein HflD [Pseudomonadota bacterium]